MTLCGCDRNARGTAFGDITHEPIICQMFFSASELILSTLSLQKQSPLMIKMVSFEFDPAERDKSCGRYPGARGSRGEVIAL